MENNNSQGKKIAESNIFKNFLNRAEEYLNKPSRLKDLINEAYKKASDKKDIGTIAHDVWESIQTLSRLIKAAATGEYTGIPTGTIIGGIAILLYFISPIDFVADFIPVIGLLDDVALLAWFMGSIKTEMDKFTEWERGNHVATAGAGTGSAATNQYTTATAPDLTNQTPVTDPENEVVVKDFTAHDVNTSNNSSGTSGSGLGAPTTFTGSRMPKSSGDGGDSGGNVH